MTVNLFWLILNIFQQISQLIHKLNIFNTADQAHLCSRCDRISAIDIHIVVNNF